MKASLLVPASGLVAQAFLRVGRSTGRSSCAIRKTYVLVTGLVTPRSIRR
jgi:hypothetical protein